MSDDETQGLRLLDANLKSQQAPFTDAQIQTILEDNVGAGGQADGMVVGIVGQDGSRVISAGMTDGRAGKGRKVDGDTVFRIGSITKVFTTLLLEDMIARGEMSLDDPVQKYLPPSVRMPMHGSKPITLFDLATHTSGLPRDIEGPSGTPQQLYASLARLKLKRDPGAQWEYSNLGMGLLGHVIAMKAGKDYETLIVERICRPLGMGSTRITVTPEMERRLATGHAFPGKPMKRSQSNGPLAGCGALHSTVNDLLKFVSANLGLTQSPLTLLMQKAQSVHRTASGRESHLAWSAEGAMLSHGGLTNGFHSNLGFDTAKKRGVVILDNCEASRLTVPLLRILIDDRSPRPAQVAHVDAATLDGYVGQYRFKGGAVCDVERQGDRLLLHCWHGQPRYPMPFAKFEVFAQSQTVYYDPMWGNRVVFEFDDTGQATRLIANNPREHVKNAVGQRIADTPGGPPLIEAQPDVYQRYAGQYRAAVMRLVPFGPTLNVYISNDEVGCHLMGYVQGVEGRLVGELYPGTENTFFNPALDDCWITFKSNAWGETTGVVLKSPDREIRGIRVGDEPIKPAD